MHQYMLKVEGRKGVAIVPKISLWVSYPSGMILGTEMLNTEDGMEKLEASFQTDSQTRLHPPRLAPVR